MDNFFKKNHFFLISLGAIPAAILRWQVDQIYIVNIIGCFLLGFINALPISRTFKLTFGVGLCGSLTTFSGWSFQLFQLLNQKLYQQFFLNTIFFVLIALCFVCIGNVLAKKITN